jgi:putative ABC transport system ATP-binding protein
METVSLSQLKFKYPNSDRGRLDIESFKVEQGERIFLYGPSGVGKTTFLEILAGVLNPDSGTISIAGTDWTKLSPSQKDSYRADQIGYIFQSFNLIPYLTVQENIALPLHLSKKRRDQVPPTHENEIIAALANRLGIFELLDHKTTELSVGQQQRVAAARAVIGHPQLILADEPTSALDYDHREKFLKLLFDVCREQSISLIFVSHDRSLQPLFDRVVALSELNKATPENSKSEL